MGSLQNVTCYTSLKHVDSATHLLFAGGYLFKNVNSKKNIKRTVVQRSTRKLRAEALESRQLLAAYISELAIDPLFGSTTEGQYIELRGGRAATLPENSYLVSVDETRGDQGEIIEVFDLSGLQFGSNGYLVLMQPNSPYVDAPNSLDPNANIITAEGPGFAGLDGDRYSDTHSVVDELWSLVGARGFFLIQTDQPIFLGTDIDADNNGRIDPIIADAWTIWDSISLHDFVGRGNVAYGDIVFAERGATPDGSISIGRRAGVPLVETEGSGYAARVGESTGSTPDDWFFSTIEDGDNFNQRPYENWELSASLFGEPSQVFLMGKDLDHIGGPNFVSGVSGTVATGDGQAIHNAVVFLDIDGDGSPSSNTFIIDPDDIFFADEPPPPPNINSGPHLLNAWPGTTVNTWALDSFPSSGVTAEQEQIGFNGIDNYHFSKGGIYWFSEGSRLRFDFHRPIESASILAIGPRSSSSRAIGRLTAHAADGTVLGTTISQPLGPGQRERIHVNASEPISYVTAYTDTDFDESEGFGRLVPFGQFDDFLYTQTEPRAFTDSDGTYRFTHTAVGELNVVASAGGLVSGSQAASFDRYSHPVINFGLLPNQAPIIETSQLSIAEDALGGTSAGFVVASDPENGEIEFQIDNDAESRFTIDSSTGEVFLKSNGSLDFESTDRYIVPVTVMDPEGRSSTSNITITVDDVNEPPILVTNRFEVAEDTALATVFGPLSSLDPENHVVSYELLSFGSPFTLTSSGFLILSQNLDFATQDRYELEVRLRDSGSPTATTTRTVVIDVLDRDTPPDLTDSQLTIDETFDSAEPLLRIEPTDPDGGPANRFQVIGGTDGNRFQIDSDGSLFFDPDVEVDFETKSSFQVQIAVFVGNEAAPADTAFYQIFVRDIDEAPVIEGGIDHQTATSGQRFDFQLPETLIISDPDMVDAAPIITMAGVSGELPSWMVFDAGSRSISGTPNSVATGVIEVTLIASDSSDPTLQSSITFTIDVQRGAKPLQNASTPTDVTGDSETSALDALTVINYLIRDDAVEEITDSFALSGFVDTNGDNRITALDALLVINFLISQTAPDSEAINSLAVIESSNIRGENMMPIDKAICSWDSEPGLF
ncbi:MAG: cadherin domain-containing protein [Planctomycetota bacterium]